MRMKMEISVKVSKLIAQIPSLQKQVTIRTLSKIIVTGTVIIKKTKEKNEYTFSCYLQ